MTEIKKVVHSEKIWAEARSYGLNIPEKPDFIPLEEREKESLAVVAGYTAELYSELLDPLDLSGHLKV